MSKANWYLILRRVRCPLINSILIEGMTKFHTENFPLNNYAYVDSFWYADKDEWDRLLGVFSKVFEDDPKFLIRDMENAYHEWHGFENYLKTYMDINWQELTDLKIREHFHKFSDFLLRWNGKYLQFMLLPEKILTQKLKDVLKKHKMGKQEDFLVLTSSGKEGFFEQAERRLREIKDDKDIDGFLQEFSWLANTDFNSLFWDKAYVEERMLNLKGADEKNSDINDITENFDESEKTLVNIVRELVYFRTFRTDIIWKAGWYAQPMFNEITKRLKLDIHGLFYFEVLDALEGKKLDVRLINRRKNKYAIVVEKGKVKFYHENIEELKKQFQLETDDHSQVSGSVASLGKVKGKVKLVNSVDDISKVKEGEILVTSMTKPKYIPAMEKAAAFVTDEGGITCHAAIIAREMKKPCVIGTKFATKVFKDGDIVEVDAEKGVVRKVG